MSALATSGATDSPAPIRRRRVVINSKHATPELPVLEGAAAELLSLDEFGLLPAAAIDGGEFDFRTPTTAVPASREEQSEEESEGDVDTSAVAFTSGSFSADGGLAGSYAPMWCSLRVVAGGNVMAVPVADASADCLPQSGEGRLVKLWCWVQPDAEGERLVVPTVDRVGDGPSLEDMAAPLLAASKQAPSWSFNVAPTTIEVANLPAGLTQEDFLEILDREEASGLYDFVFFPTTPSAALGRRVAVVNCISADHAQYLAEKLSVRTFWGAAGSQQCEVSWFGVQGLGGLLEFFQSAVEDVEDSVQPLLFADGWPGQMPRQTLCEAVSETYFD